MVLHVHAIVFIVDMLSQLCIYALKVWAKKVCLSQINEAILERGQAFERVPKWGGALLICNPYM